MKNKYLHSVLFFLFFSFILTSGASYAQEKQMPAKDQTTVSKDEVPITTTSQESRQKYVEGIKYLENSQVDKARELFQEAVKTDPNFALGYLGLAMTGGGYVKAKENYEKAENLSSNVSEGEKHLINYSKAQFEGNESKQNDELQQLLTMFPKDKRIQFFAGQFYYFSNNDFDTAISHFKKATDIDPNYAPAYNLLGYAYAGKDDFKNAETAFKKYISLLPDNPNPYDSYAELLLKNGQYDESIKQYTKALSLDPAFYSSYEGIGNNYLFKGDFAKARENFQKLYDKATTSTWKLNSLYDQAVSYIREQDEKNALSALDKRISLAESEGAIPSLINSHIMEGLIIAANGKTDEAMKHFDMAAEKINSSDLSENVKSDLTNQVKLNKLYAMAGSGKTDAAMNTQQSKDQTTGAMKKKDMPEVTSADPKAKHYDSIMGMAALEQGKYDDAISHLSKSADQNPLDWYFLSEAYRKNGDTQKADQLINKITKSNQSSLELAVANNMAKESVAKVK